MVSEKSCGVVIFRSGDGDTGPEPENGEWEPPAPGPDRLYLLLHYEEGHWDFPKGHVEEGEEDLDTATREAEEETGISDLEFVFGFRERVEYFYVRDGTTMHKEVFFFLAETKTSDVRLSSEHIGSEWLPYGDALRRLTYENARDVLKAAHKFLG